MVLNKSSDDMKSSLPIARNSVVLINKDGAGFAEEKVYAAANEHEKDQIQEKPKEHGVFFMAKDTALVDNPSNSTIIPVSGGGNRTSLQTETERPKVNSSTATPVHQMNKRTSAIVVVGCKRKNYIISIAHTLQKLPEIENYSLFLSLGCLEFLKKPHFDNVKELSAFTILEFDDMKMMGFIPKPFKRIQLHYRFFLQALFESYHFNRVIVLEDDLELSPSLLHFFEATSPLLDRDETIACISAYNDNAVADTGDAKLLRRSSYFPNLALMFSLQSYNKLWKDQPLTRVTNGWDHWLRVRAASLHMEGVFPVIPRVRHGCSANSTTAQNSICKKLKGYPLFPEKSADLGNMDYILSENYDRFLLSQFFDPEKIEQAIQLFSLSEEILLKENKTLPDFYPSYQSNVNVEVYKPSAISSILKPSNTVNVLLLVREVGLFVCFLTCRSCDMPFSD